LNEEISRVIVFDLSKVEGKIDNEVITNIKKFIRKKLGFKLASFEDASKPFGVNVLKC